MNTKEMMRKLENIKLGYNELITDSIENRKWLSDEEKKALLKEKLYNININLLV